MEETTRNDIRRLLKVFGIQADEAMMAQLAQRPDTDVLRVRAVLEDITDGDGGRVLAEVTGDVRR